MYKLLFKNIYFNKKQHMLSAINIECRPTHITHGIFTHTTEHTKVNTTIAVL